MQNLPGTKKLADANKRAGEETMNFNIDDYVIKNEAQAAFIRYLHNFNDHMITLDERMTKLTQKLTDTNKPLGLICPENIEFNMQPPNHDKTILQIAPSDVKKLPNKASTKQITTQAPVQEMIQLLEDILNRSQEDFNAFGISLKDMKLMQQAGIELDTFYGSNDPMVTGEPFHDDEAIEFAIKVLKAIKPQ